jgi:hypothetical protein
MSPTDTKESQITFIGPKPTQPFPSWTWENNQWIAPHPKPVGPYLWNETSQQWDQAEANFPYPTK